MANIAKKIKYLLISVFFCFRIVSAETIEIPNPTGKSNFYDFLNSITTAFIYLSAPIAIGAIIYSGYLYISSGGDESEVEKAKNVATWAIVGFIIVLISKGLVLAIKDLFGVKN